MVLRSIVKDVKNNLLCIIIIYNNEKNAIGGKESG